MIKILRLARIVTLLCSTLRSYFCVCLFPGSAAQVETRFDCTAVIKDHSRTHPSDIRVWKQGCFIVYRALTENIRYDPCNNELVLNWPAWKWKDAMEIGMCQQIRKRCWYFFFIFSKRISQWDVIHSIFNPTRERRLGCLWYPKGIITATGSLGAIAGPAPHVEQLWERFLRSLGHLVQLSEGLSCWISWSGVGKKCFACTGSESTCSVIPGFDIS